MGLACEMLGYHVANPGSTFTAVTMATGDSAVVRQFTQGTVTLLEGVFRQSATSGGTRILSAVLHDQTRGITIITAETPSIHSLPPRVGQPMQPGDTLTIQMTGGTAETEVGAIQLYYQDVLGIAARLYNWGDIAGQIEHIKPLEVDCTPNGTAGVWSDTLINSTEDLLRADRKYAVLGYITDTAACAIAVKGAETGNVRIGGPGTTSNEDTDNWFLEQSEKHGTPHIPVISANNKGSTNVSLLTTATSGTVKVGLMMALLRAGF